MSAFSQASHNYTMNAANGGNTYTLQIGFVPGAPTTFSGLAALTGAETITISKNGAVVSTESVDNYFSASPYTPLGMVNLSNGQYSVVSNQVALPANATVGQSGQFITLTTYTSNSMATIYSTTTETWVLSSNTATTAWLCLNFITTPVGSSAYSGSGCYTIDTTGNVSALKMAITVSGTTLNFQ